jgi:hypothetical protein
MTILAPTPTTPQHTSLLTGFDVMAAAEALQHAAASDCTGLSIRDRRALTLLSYDRTVCRALAALLIERVVDGTYPLPVDESRAKLLLRLVDRLPEVPEYVQDQWLAARERVDVDADPVNRAVRIIACEAVRNPGTSTYTDLLWTVAAIRAERVHASSAPIPDHTRVEAHQWACDLVKQTGRELMDAEYGQTPAAVNA